MNVLLVCASIQQVSKRDGRIKWSEVTHLKKGGVFTHGSIAELRRLKGECVSMRDRDREREMLPPGGKKGRKGGGACGARRVRSCRAPFVVQGSGAVFVTNTGEGV